MCSRLSSRHSSASKASSATARLQALAEAKAAREEAQYTRLIVQKELEIRTREAEAQKIRQQEIAQFETEIAILGADKKAAMANAKLKVFDEALLEEELEKDFKLPELEVPKIKAEERSSQWVHSNPLTTGKVSRPERNHEPLSTPKPIMLPLRPTPEERKSEKTDPSLNITSKTRIYLASNPQMRIVQCRKIQFSTGNHLYLRPL